MSFYHNTSNQTLLEEVMAWALIVNNKKWCKWINSEFQQLRNPKLKEMYCKSCGL